MAFQPVGQTYQATLNYRQDAQEVQNCLYFEYTGVADSTPMTNLANALITWWGSNLKPLQSTTVALDNVEVRDLEVEGGLVVVSQSSLPDFGSQGDTPLPNGTCLSVSFRTGLAGRSHRGRNYTVGMTQSQYIQSDAELAYATAIVEAYEALISLATAQDLVWVVVSRWLNKAKRAVGIRTPITSVLVADLTLDSQRRRLPGRGN